MMSIEGWTLAIAVVTSLVCALSGSLLLVSKKAMVSEGLSHAVLPGIVIAFIVFRDHQSAWLILFAAASGLLMVWLTERLQQTRLVDEDSSLGIVFSGMFSLGILLISRYLRQTQFHADHILDGDLVIAAAAEPVVWAGLEFGPASWLLMCAMLVVVTAFITMLFKELQLTLFDSVLAERFRLRPEKMQLAMVAVISLTTVTAFRVAGSVLIVALMIAPAAAAYLLTNQFRWLLLIACGMSSVSAVAGHFVAGWLDISHSGPMASVAGFVFLGVLVAAPKKGLAKLCWQRHRAAKALEIRLIEEILEQHPQANSIQLAERLNWSHRRLTKCLQRRSRVVSRCQ